MPDYNLPQEPINPVLKAQRFVLGILVLIIVDFIWVSSSELTEYIFKTQNYSKPFFSTFVKTSLFLLYLPGFLVYKPWRDQCKLSLSIKKRSNSTPSSRAGNGYTRVAGDSESERSGAEDLETDQEDGEQEGQEGGETTRIHRGLSRSLSEPMYTPVNGLLDCSGTDSEPDIGQRKVRFSRVAEVREMSAREALHANLARLSYAASLRAAHALRRAANRLGVMETAQLALTFNFIWFVGNYSYQAALADTEAGIVNVLSASSCFFTLILSAFFPSTPADKPTVTKIFAVIFSIIGVVLVSYSDLKMEEGFPKGALWALCGSLSYSGYIVFLRRKIDHEDKLDVPMFFGFVGLFCFVTLWPLFLVLHFTEIELFQWPNPNQWLAMLVNGIIGTVFSELLWLFGCFYTSSLVATLAISLTIPLTMFADVLLKDVQYDLLFYVGSVPMFLSFFIVAGLTHMNNWDPILDAFVYLGSWVISLCRFKRDSAVVVKERMEREFLINRGAQDQDGEEEVEEQDENSSHHVQVT